MNHEGNWLRRRRRHRKVNPRVFAWTKWILYFAAWAGVIIVTACDNPENLKIAWAFPVGFFGFLPEEVSIMAALWGMWSAIATGWLLYIILGLVTIKANRVWIFSVLYILFCLLLALNLGGCQKLIHTTEQIQ